MKGIFLYFNSDPEISASGEVKKVRMQIDALKSYGLDVKEVCIDKSKRKDCFTRRIPFYPSCGKDLLEILLKEGVGECDFIYIRKYIIDLWFLYTLSVIKKKKKNIKILFEVPTYPYDLEWNRLIDKPMLLKEKISRTKLYLYIDRIITLSNDDYIWGIPTIKINNGINVKDITPIKKKCFEKGITILIGVALIAKWHGYDRVVEGLKDYYQNQSDEKVIFWIVGDGPELENLRKRVTMCNVEKYVRFIGKKQGEELEKIYNKADVAIGSLGMHRIGLQCGSTLKVREYCAKGIPFIKGYMDTKFDKADFQYMLTFPNDDSNINISEIIEFSRRMKKLNSVQEKMHKFAEENLSWEQEMKIIFQYIS